MVEMVTKKFAFGTMISGVGLGVMGSCPVAFLLYYLSVEFNFNHVIIPMALLPIGWLIGIYGQYVMTSIRNIPNE